MGPGGYRYAENMLYSRGDYERFIKLSKEFVRYEVEDVSSVHELLQITFGDVIDFVKNKLEQENK